VRHALQPADTKHRFGHGKAESLAGLAQAAFIAGSAFFLLLEGFNRLLHPQPLEVVGVGIWVMGFSIIATSGLIYLQAHVVKKTGSSAIRADSLHYKTDLLVNASVIAALLLTAYGWSGFDPVFAIVISLYILHSAWEIGHESAQALMDHELPDEDRQRITSIALQHPQTRGVHDLRTRKSGTTAFIQLHLELDDELSLVLAHAISDEVEARIRAAYPSAEIIIHEDPASIMEPKAFND
jgi:ferrous-iron efflux pump FieF